MSETLLDNLVTAYTRYTRAYLQQLITLEEYEGYLQGLVAEAYIEGGQASRELAKALQRAGIKIS